MLWTLALAFLKVGLLGFGGGPGSIGIIEDASRPFLSKAAFAEMLVVGQALPGPIATKLAAAIGYRAAGWPGAVVSTLAVTLPSIVLFFALFRLLSAGQGNPFIGGALRGAGVVVGAILLALALDYIPVRQLALAPWALFGLAFAALYFLRLPLPLVILAGLVAGAFVLRS